MIYINKNGILVVAINIFDYTREYSVIGIEELKDIERKDAKYYDNSKYILGFLYKI